MMSASAHNRGFTVANATTALVAILSIASLTACVTRQPSPAAAGQRPAASLVPSPLVGQPLDVVSAESSLIVRVYRAGPLAALGHNHVIACRCITGTLYVPRDPLRASFDLRIPVDQLTVDDPILRASEHSTDFPPDVLPSAQQGTRHNMLGGAVLQADKYPYIALRSAGVRRSPDGRRKDILVYVLVWIDGTPHPIVVPMHYEMRDGGMVVSGEFPLKQTDLGLVPFGALGGALRVRNSINVRFRLIARRRVS